MIAWENSGEIRPVTVYQVVAMLESFILLLQLSTIYCSWNAALVLHGKVASLLALNVMGITSGTWASSARHMTKEESQN